MTEKIKPSTGYEGTGHPKDPQNGKSKEDFEAEKKAKKNEKNPEA